MRGVGSRFPLAVVAGWRGPRHLVPGGIAGVETDHAEGGECRSDGGSHATQQERGAEAVAQSVSDGAGELWAVVSQAGAVLLVETVSRAGLGRAVSTALAPWRHPRAVHDPGNGPRGPQPVSTSAGRDQGRCGTLGRQGPA
ncbi:transposase, partial [Streptomyces sp. 8L]|nr:transposase [Streptomyces sp. 8L]